MPTLDHGRVEVATTGLASPQIPPVPVLLPAPAGHTPAADQSPQLGPSRIAAGPNLAVPLARLPPLGRIDADHPHLALFNAQAVSVNDLGKARNFASRTDVVRRLSKWVRLRPAENCCKHDKNDRQHPAAPRIPAQKAVELLIQEASDLHSS